MCGGGRDEDVLVGMGELSVGMVRGAERKGFVKNRPLE
jgi:hypothetical protein